MAFRSLLYGDVEAGDAVEHAAEPACFADLNLDQVVRAVISHRDPYRLTPYFHAPLDDPRLIRFRQEVFDDLDRVEVSELADEFAARELVAHYDRQRLAMQRDGGGFAHYHVARGFLNATLVYCETVRRLADRLDAVGLRAQGLLELRDHLAVYVDDEPFRSLRDEARGLDEELDRVRYSVLLNGSKITVGPEAEQPDYSAEVTATFARFRQGDGTADRQQPRDWDTYAAIGILHLVAKVHPELFGRLDAFCDRHVDYLDQTVRVLDRELQFYLRYRAYIQPLRDAGLSFSLPRVSAGKAEQALDTFDLALAAQRIPAGEPVVANDVSLDGPERILVITGPNNGGKTTMARTIGQLHYLARLGCPVPGRDTHLFLCDQIFTRFERQEDAATLTGKLQDELNLIRDALGAATPRSLFVLNELFNSTTARDALFLSRQILARISELDALCVSVTFLDELATFDEKTASMVSTVDPDDPAIRTHRLVRRRADGRAYARAIAEKYGLTYERLIQRSRT